ncbi:patatin-like phospholipase family protein [Actinomycetota bacterium]
MSERLVQVPSPEQPERPRVALALGAGGARGYTHIGVMQVLQERGYEVAAIAGTSMGALVGGIAAAGEIEKFTEWARGLTQMDVVRLLDPALAEAGALRGVRVFTALSELLGDRMIEDLPIPFTAVSADLYARREVWFQSGPLDEAIRASVAIPSVITPVLHEGRTLVDGGVLNPVPIEPLSATPCDLTVAVSLSGSSPQQPQTPTHEAARTEERIRAADWVRAKGAAVASTIRESLTPTAPQAVMRSLEQTTRALDTMGDVIARYRLAGRPPDVLITIPSDAARTFDFHRAEELIDLGRRLAEVELDRAGR